MKHRTFNADRFLDKFEGSESLLQNYVSLMNGHLPIQAKSLDVTKFKEFLLDGSVDGKDDLLEGLYRAYDLCSEQGHEGLIASCRELGFNPDPEGKLPVECLSLKILTENEEAFNLSYDRHTLWNAERFSIYRAKSVKPIQNISSALKHFQEALSQKFKEDKNSERVLIRQYREGIYVNFIVYHEKRTKAELVFKGAKVRPTLLRPAQQDFISYNEQTGQVEIEARFENEESILRKCFAECCLDENDIFEGPDAGNRLALKAIAQSDFNMAVDDGHTAKLVGMHFRLMQKHGPSFTLSSKDALETLDLNNLRQKLDPDSISKAVFKFTFPDDARGRRVELSGTNRIKFKRATHADDIFRYLNNWGILLV